MFIRARLVGSLILPVFYIFKLVSQTSLLLGSFLQTKTVIDKLQKLVSSEGRFKNLREALKK